VSARGDRTSGARTISARTSSAFARLRWSARELRRRWRGRRGAPAPVDPARALLVGLALSLAVLATALFLDAALTQWVREWPAAVRRFFSAVTLLGDSLYVFVLSALVMLGAILARARAGISRALDATLATLAARAVFVFVVCAGSGLLSQILKRLIGRARPRLFDEHGPFHFVFPGFPSTYASFPSGHTITAFACAAALAWFVPRWRWPLFALAALVGVSRVAVGAHYASDVVAGAAIGCLSAAALRRAFAARGIAFRLAGPRIFVRRAGLIWPALRGGMR